MTDTAITSPLNEAGDAIMTDTFWQKMVMNLKNNKITWKEKD